jgi:integrase
MPLKLRAPRPGKTPYYEIRGSHLGVSVEQSTKTSNAKLALQLLKAKQRDIECGAVARPGEPTFAEAAERYMIAGGDNKFMAPLLRHFTNTPLSRIDQAAIDDAAGRLYPNASMPTRNRQVYTPVSAVLKRAGFEFKVKRPKGWKGKRRTTWLRPEQAFAVFKACDQVKAPEPTKIELRILLRTLCYTGMRIEEALSGMQCQTTNLKEGTTFLANTKNGEPRLVYLPGMVIEELKALPNPIKGRVGRVFRFHQGGRLRDLLKEALAIAGVVVTERVAFHLFCHTWGTWMRMFGGLTTEDLLTTKRWVDPASAKVYDHVVVSDPAKKADLLPVERVA